VNPSPVVILVETMGPANIGSVARSAAAFGLEHFRLVQPRCEVDEETRKWACYGSRILESVQQFEDLPSALHDVGFAVALSRREGKDRHRHYSLPHLAEEILPRHSSAGRVGLVFGNEESGLAKSHLALCHGSAEIPVVADDGSLNLSHAVTTTLYELVGRPRGKVVKPQPKNLHEEMAPPSEINRLLSTCEQTLRKVGYPRHRSTLEEELVKLESIAWRSRLENWEVRLLLGMLKQANYRLDHPK
jgi:TrmH family RNA methyltransferase